MLRVRVGVNERDLGTTIGRWVWEREWDRAEEDWGVFSANKYGVRQVEMLLRDFQCYFLFFNEYKILTISKQLQSVFI